MPGISRRAATSRRARSCGWLLAMSAPFRYARILNAFSFLISRRSAISRSTRAIAALSNAEAVRLEMEVQDAGAASRQGGGNRVAAVRRTVAEQTPTAAGTAYFR